MTGVDRPPSHANRAAEKRRTVLVLGASNVSLAWSEIVSLVTQSSTEPVDLVTAHGMGRAYVTRSSGFAFRRLPGILHSGLWDAFDDFGTDDTPSVLITDLGNDLLYGRSVSEVIDGAVQCLHRIREWRPHADFVLTAPPLESVLSLSPMRFRIFKRLLFPFSSLTLPEVKKATQDLFDGVQQISHDESIKIFVPPNRCFGFDPIHVRHRHRRDVFHSMLAMWDQPSSLSVKWDRFRRVVPECRLIMGRERRQTQPVIYENRLRVFAF